MSRLRALAAIPVGLVPMAPAAVGAADVPEPPPDPTLQSSGHAGDVADIEVRVVRTELDGTPVSDERTARTVAVDELRDGEPAVASLPDASSTADGIGVSTEAVRTGGPSSAATGCVTLDIGIHVRRTVGVPAWTLYRYHQHKYFCFDRHAGIVSNPSWYDYVSDVDPLWGPQDVIADDGHFYAAWSGYKASGHESFTQRHMRGCVLTYGCYQNDYPWVRVIGFADGAWWSDVGL